ncbi:MAG: FMN adenylyltransferase / Riboflavin kinase [uncultured Sphingomonadaceae bacterium]|uniref:Riboflavin biosynthesis protein n=1 Tax=uncultured Sphingomonadaceae bacterium TaxID=169976 RepID=A0A6J4SX90_9SPHN|nr:MAG: FMN adenylyltransferase / Riboflavin kinase [uncultured Sphingomonadaceae bacterium]
MQRLDGSVAVPPELRGGIVALGNFDGFHRGHQAVVGRAVERARAEGRPALVATFDPHPVRHFRPDAPPFGLTTIAERARLFADAGADATIVYRFDGALAALTAEAFVAERLGRLAGAAGVVTGEDFTFGARRGGTATVLREFGRAHGIAAETVPPLLHDGASVSSSRIREALKAGEPEAAAALLTRSFSIEGVVQHGDKRGRELGYPTANLTLGDYVRPRYGIYAVRGRLPGGQVADGVANLGLRPQFEPVELLEPFFFDFSGDLYGETIAVDLVGFIRPEAKFDSLGALIAQMDADSRQARARLAAFPHVA